MAIKELNDKAVESVNEDIRKDPGAGIPSSTEAEVFAAQEENKEVLRSEAQQLAFEKAKECISLFLERCNAYKEKYQTQCKAKRKEQLDVVTAIREKAEKYKEEVASGQFTGATTDIATIQAGLIKEIKEAQTKLIGIRETCTAIREEMRPFCPHKVKGKIEAREAPVVSKVVENAAVTYDDYSGDGYMSPVVVDTTLQNEVVTSIPTAGLSEKIQEVDEDSSTYFGNRSMGVADSTVLTAENAVASIVDRNIDPDCTGGGTGAGFFGGNSNNCNPDPDPVPVDPCKTNPNSASCRQQPQPQPIVRTDTKRDGGNNTTPVIDPTNTTPDGKTTTTDSGATSELGGSNALGKTGSDTSGFGGLGSMFPPGTTPESYGTDTYSGYGEAPSYYNTNGTNDNNQYANGYNNNYGNINSRYDNGTNSKLTPGNNGQPRGYYDANGNYIGGGQPNNMNTGTGRFAESGYKGNSKKTTGTTLRDSGNKQVFGKSKNGVTGGIFGASSKDEKFNRQMASLKSKGKSAMFDPDRYEPSLRAQAKALARGTGRVVSGKVQTVSCQQSKVKTIPGTCDIRVHAGTADVFNVISPSVRYQLGQDI